MTVHGSEVPQQPLLPRDSSEGAPRHAFNVPKQSKHVKGEPHVTAVCGGILPASQLTGLPADDRHHSPCLNPRPRFTTPWHPWIDMRLLLLRNGALSLKNAVPETLPKSSIPLHPGSRWASIVRVQ
jgi:hypothetical protein